MDQRQATADALPTIEEGYKYGKTNAAVVHVNEALAAVGALGTIAAAALYKKGEDDDRKNRLLFVILLYFRVPPAKPSAAGGTHTNRAATRLNSKRRTSSTATINCEIPVASGATNIAKAISAPYTIRRASFNCVCFRSPIFIAAIISIGN